MAEAQFRLDSGRSAQSIDRANRLLKAVSEIQLSYIREKGSHSRYDVILRVLLALTDSEYGFIGEIQSDDDAASWLKSRAITNLAADEASWLCSGTTPSDDEGPSQVLQALFSETMRSRSTVIADPPPGNVLRGEQLEGHPSLSAFLAIPLLADDELIGMVGLANRLNGYDQKLVNWLEPVCVTCTALIAASRMPLGGEPAGSEAALDETLPANPKQTLPARHPDASQLSSLLEKLSFVSDGTDEQAAEQTVAQQQAQLIHVSRLSTMGQMMAAISHEIAQPLSAISNFASACTMILQHPSPDLQKLDGYVGEVAEQARRAGQILDRVRAFVRPTKAHRSTCDLVQLVTDSLALVKADLRRRQVHVEATLPEEPLLVLADAVQIQQVIVNLISNACDALQELPADDRLIWIRCFQDQQSAVVEIIDNGAGVAPEVRHRVFEAFYTSKSNGMGIGLTICNDIVKSHFGSIDVETSPAHGALFRFFLPIVKQHINE